MMVFANAFRCGERKDIKACRFHSSGLGFFPVALIKNAHREKERKRDRQTES